MKQKWLTLLAHNRTGDKVPATVDLSDISFYQAADGTGRVDIFLKSGHVIEAAGTSHDEIAESIARLQEADESEDLTPVRHVANPAKGPDGRKTPVVSGSGVYKTPPPVPTKKERS